MAEKISQRELFATPQDIERAQAIVEEELGPGFFVDYTLLPKNVGVMGDEGVRAHSVLITSDLASPAKFLAENDELMCQVVKRICGETGAACRVLLDVTPVPDGSFNT